ncbi:hypothetical protein, partial [Helicobacter suis]|uniref:hypothetical protein n=1 Tax=Helicobacter suis TaxID=104628 RepID=UPI0013D8D07F
MMTKEELKAYIEANKPKDVDVSFEPGFQYIPRLTKSSFIYFKGKHAGEYKDLAEERKVKEYVLKNVGNIDIRRRYNTEEEKRQMVEFLNGTKYDFAIAVVVRILLESRGCYKELADKRRVENLVLKFRRWQKANKADPYNGLKKKPRDMSHTRK